MDALTFDSLNDIALASQRRRVQPIEELGVVTVENLGPLAELYLFLDEWSLPLESLNIGRVSLSARCLARACNSDMPVQMTMSPYVCGALRLTNMSGKGEDLAFTKFGYEAQQAAQACGVPLNAAQSLVGAIQELRDNILEHSHRVDSGLLLFAGSPNRFEFCVADCGIGVLQSLRENPAYHYLENSGQAIEIAISPGESRYGRESGHGMGFSELFRGLQKLNSYVRFRSGDHALDISGAMSTEPRHQLSQAATVKGFLISVMCDIGTSSSI